VYSLRGAFYSSMIVPLYSIFLGNWEGPELGHGNYFHRVPSNQEQHFLLNEQEYRRLPGQLGESISSNTDDLTLHELYAWPFMNALRAGTGAIMCSYQRANNSCKFTLSSTGNCHINLATKFDILSRVYSHKECERRASADTIRWMSKFQASKWYSQDRVWISRLRSLRLASPTDWNCFGKCWPRYCHARQGLVG
jgi:hypothetical protein